jgi:hypothetical protein
MRWFASFSDLGRRVLYVQLVSCAVLALAFAWLLSPRPFESLYQPPKRMVAPLTARDGVATFTYNSQTDDGKYLYRAADGTMQPFYNKSGAELRAEFAARKAKEATAR